MIHRSRCIVCGGRRLWKAIDLGSMPNANELVDKKHMKMVKNYHLSFYWCQDCCLLQQLNLADRKELFNAKYTFQTGTMQPHIEYYTELAKLLGRKVKRKGFAVVIASNDGTEIDLVGRLGGFRKVIGVEPSGNMAEIANKRGLKTINKFFGYETSCGMVRDFGRADFVMANNVFAHIPDPEDMLLGIRNMLKEDGVATIEVQWLNSVVRELMIDTLYAEHYYEWSIKAMKTLAGRCGMSVVNTDFLPTRTGGSVRFWLKRGGHAELAGVKRMELEEKRTGLYSRPVMMGLQARADMRRNKLRDTIARLNHQGKTIDIWAVSAKVPTILNFSGIDHKSIRCAYDSTPNKMGKYIPKAGIPVKDEGELNRGMQNPPDYLLIGAWNFLDFAKKKHGWFLKRGGKMINMLNGEIVK